MLLKKGIDAVISKFSGREKTLFLLLTIIAGIIILWPLHNFQHYLAQGDHGRDLYCFKKTMDGALPYRDYSWLFGPLMPYYYGIFYFLGGVSIQSVLLGQGLLVLLVGIFVFLTCSVFLSPAMSFVCALWYWCFRGMEFFYTYNHIGGLLTLVAALYCLFRYIRDNRLVHVYAGLVSIFLLTLIRLNMGISTLIAFVSCLLLADFVQKDTRASQKRRTYFFLSLVIVAAAFLIYWFLVYPLPKYAILQSFPFGKAQRVDYSPTTFSAVQLSWKMIASYFTATLPQKIFGALIFLTAVESLTLILSNKLPLEVKRNNILTLSSLLIFIILTSHEFIASGVLYRLFWILPLVLIIIFHFFSIATRKIPSHFIQGLILVTFIFPALWNVRYDHLLINSYKKNPAFHINIGENRIYTTQHPFWIQTVTEASNYIKNNVPLDEKILILPLDPLYLFLSERDSATRQLVFFEHINIPEEQEKKIIAEMEAGKKNWVIISNRSVSPEPGMGTFGKTYCPLLANYIDEHFTLAAQFGDWTNPPGWAWNHGVRILKRIK